MSVRYPFRRNAAAALLSIACTGGLGLGLALSSEAAHAQLSVFDPTNYSQNLLTAARTLTQINNQIQSLQNEATMLVNQAKNLSRIEFPEVQALTRNLEQIDRLMGQAQGIRFEVSGLDQQFARLFPRGAGLPLKASDQLAAARARLDAALSAHQQTLSVQSQVAENVAADARTLSALVTRSQGAEGALQASQATNQLLALSAKQQFQLQSMIAAQYRAETIERARRAQAEIDAAAATKRFLGTGTAYTPLPAGK
ncbi:MAG: P-type conjugative transfer protein TrbJ [Novosphingobium sp.]|nr:MAG: P-type conjugative transfer protein TrbJ [Novosphingobium sp.]